MHRVGALLMAIPLFIVIVSGLLLQVKKQVPWVQPPTQRGSTDKLSLSFDEVLVAAMANEQAVIASWQDIDRLDVRPSKGVIKVRCVNGWEIQLDSQNGNTLSTEYRRSDWIESLHDGSFFSEFAKFGIFLPNGIVLLMLWASGLYLWYLPHRTRAIKKRKVNSINKKVTDD